MPQAVTRARIFVIHTREVELLGVADRPVHLQGRARGEVGGVSGGHLRGRHVTPVRVERGSEHERPREVESYADVGQRVLDRLVAADLAAELLALLHVGDRVGEHPLAGPEQLGRGRECGQVRTPRRASRPRRSTSNSAGCGRPRRAGRPRTWPGWCPRRRGRRRRRRVRRARAAGAPPWRRPRPRRRGPAAGRRPTRPRGRGRRADRAPRRRSPARPGSPRWRASAGPARPAGSTALRPGSWSPSAQARATATVSEEAEQLARARQRSRAGRR